MKPKNPYIFFDKFYLRTPILSLGFYFNLTNKEKISIENLKSIWTNTSIQEAIFITSSEFFLTINKCFSGEITDSKKIDRIKSSSLKYLSRMSARYIAFGLFTGYTLGEFSKSTTIELEVLDKHHRQNQFDMNFLVAFSHKLAQIESIKKQLLWFSNNSFKLEIKNELTLVYKNKDNLKKEIYTYKNLNKQLNKKYRSLKKETALFLSFLYSKEVFQILVKNIKKNNKIIKSMLETEQNNALEISTHYFISKGQPSI